MDEKLGTPLDLRSSRFIRGSNYMMTSPYTPLIILLYENVSKGPSKMRAPFETLDHHVFSMTFEGLESQVHSNQSQKTGKMWIT